MRRMEFECPAENYTEHIFSIDEQICTLLKRRKELANSQPVYPPLVTIKDWAGKFDLYEDFLQSLFGVIRDDTDYRPFVEPTGFQKQIPVLKFVEKNARFYSVTMIRQYCNASVIYLHIDGETLSETPQLHPHHTIIELSIEDGYDCRMIGGSGSDGHFTHRFVISPALPDELTGINLSFKEYEGPFSDKSTGFEMVIHLD